jgi:hypothetical protein
MRRTSTLILLLLALSLGLFIWLRERHQLSTTESREALQQVLRFDPADAVALRWTYRDESLAVQRRDDQWWLEKPFEDRANPQLIHRILQLASELTIIETLGSRELRGSESGLGSRVIELEIDLADGSTLKVEVGQAGPYTETTYLRFAPYADGKEIVALADGNLRDPLRTPATDWRDPTLLDFEPAEVIAFGDNLNDLELLERAGLGVAMGNAHPRLRAAADVVIGRHDTDAIAEFLESLTLTDRSLAQRMPVASERAS